VGGGKRIKTLSIISIIIIKLIIILILLFLFQLKFQNCVKIYSTCSLVNLRNVYKFT